MKCIKACPTNALRVRQNSITFFDDLCVDCGACISACPEKVFVPVIDEITDFEKFDFKIVIPSHILFTQFGLNVLPGDIKQALLNIGFDAVEDISQSAYELSYVVAESVKSNERITPVISNFCPSLIRLIQVNYPNLIELISPFDVSREIAAREAKIKYSQKLNIPVEKIGVIFISPCPSMVVSIKQPAEKEKSWIDGAIAIRDIYNRILPEIIRIKEQKDQKDEKKFFFYGKSWGELGFILRHHDPEHTISVAGIDNIKMILNDIEDSRLKNVNYIEAFTCPQGCIGGAFCVENPYISRHTAIILEKRHGDPPELDKGKIDIKAKENYYTMIDPVIPRPTRTTEIDLTTSIKRMNQKERILQKLPQKDCGACGAPTCETFAQDCANGEADLTDCIFIKLSSR